MEIEAAKKKRYGNSKIKLSITKLPVNEMAVKNIINMNGINPKKASHSVSR